MQRTRKRSRLVLFLLTFSALTATIMIFDAFRQQLPEDSIETAEEKLLPTDWFFRQRAYPSGQIDKRAFLKAWHFRQAKQRNKVRLRSAPNNQRWELAGPTNVGGRITDIEMFPDDQNVIFAATASGGIFKSEDTGVNWRPIFDDVPNLSIGDMALAPSNKSVLYVGTGEANAGGGSLAYDGLGVYKSTNGGMSWNSAGLEDVGSIGKVIVDPVDENRVYVAAMGDLFGNNPERGVFRTEDGGESWEKILFVNDSTGAIDLALHPENPSIIYAATWERIRRPERRKYGGAGSGIFRSSDGGDTWNELSYGLPNDAASKGRIGIAIAPSDPSVLYAVYAERDGRIEGIFKSEDGGNNWDRQFVTGISTTTFMWWFGKIFVHPEQPNRVYVTALRMHESVTGGLSWGPVFQGVHVDQHALYIHPQAPNLMVNGNDGGVYVSRDGGDTYFKSGNLPITQFYTCEVDFQNPQRLFGGTQDNGTIRSLTDALDDWDMIFGGDGFRVLVDPNDANFVIAESQFGNIGYSENGGNSFRGITVNTQGTETANWNTPILFDPTDSRTVYVGYTHLYRSRQRGMSGTFETISPRLAIPSGTNLNFGTITTIDVSPIDPRIIWVGTDDGHVWVTTDDGANWTDVSLPLPNRWVTAVVADNEDANSAYVTFSGYRYNANDSHVFKTENLGQQWMDRSGDLPDIPVNDLLIRPLGHLLVLGTDIGVFSSADDGFTWDLLGEQLPNVVVTDLDYHEPTDMILAATYGRGMHRLFLDENISSTEKEERTLSLAVQTAPNPFIDQANIEFTLDDSANYRIDLLNSSGQQVKTIHRNVLSRGVQRFVLDGSDLSKGIFFLRIHNLDNDKYKIQKMIYAGP